MHTGNVRLDIAFDCSGVLANGAFVRLFSSVNSHVPFKPIVVPKTFSTSLAIKTPPSRLVHWWVLRYL